MRFIILVACAIASYFLSAGPSPAQAPDASAVAFTKEYRAKLPLLMERYVTNRKIRYRLVRYVMDGEGGRVGDEELSGVNELVTDGQQMKAVTLECKPERFKDVVQFWRPDMDFNVTRKAGKYEVTGQRLSSSNYYMHEYSRYNFHAHEPVLAGGGSGSGTTSWFDERGHKSVVETVLGAGPATWAGKPCVEVRTKWDNTHGIVTLASTYLDPAMDYATVATETDWKPDPPRGAYKAFSEVEYAPSAEGYPLPKRSRNYIKYKDGPTLKVLDVEYLAYERYTPTADHFALEKDYGLVTPAAVPVKESVGLAPPSRRRWWPWAMLAAGAALAVAAGLYRRARRPATA